MQTDATALRNLARSGARLFWFRQFMFLGATLITTTYLTSPVPVLCYLACLSAELAEIYLGRRILSETALTPQLSRRYTLLETIVAAWSSFAVSTFGVIVALMGDEAFLFVPPTYVFAAALYGTIFNHQVKPVLTARMSIYVLGFLTLGGLGLFAAPPERQFLDIAIFVTTLSASFFFVINAIVFRANYVKTRERDWVLDQREARLRSEMEERENAESARANSETRFKSLFERAPIPIREEDLSGMQRLIADVNLPDPDAFAAYLDAHPEFLDACAKEIVVVDANEAALAEHAYTSKPEMLSKVVKTLSPAAKKVVRTTVKTIHEGRSGASYETTITRADGQVRTVAATWTVLPGHEETYARILLCSVDQTERLAAEEALRQAQKMEAVGQLTGGVAHDFNNLLTVISGNLDLLEVTGDPDPELVGPIRNAVRRSAELTQRLLAFSRKQPLAARVVDLRVLVTGMLELLHRSLGTERSIAIDIPDDLWHAFADTGQIETALLNLTLNARDAMPDGGTVTYACQNVTVDEKNDLELAPGDYVVLSVTDTGTGMPSDVVARAFEPFFYHKRGRQGQWPWTVHGLWIVNAEVKFPRSAEVIFPTFGIW